jgi:hypothetical protein
MSLPARIAGDARPAARRISPRTRDELDDFERLAEVIVRAGLDAGNLLGPVVARGDDDDGELTVTVAPATQHRQAVDARQT